MKKVMKQMNWSYMVVALVLLISSCAVKKSTEMASSEITGKKWQLIEVEGSPVAERVNGRTPYLELDTNGRYAANGGCNGIGGTYEWKKNKGIKFSRGMSTMMACMDMSAEQGLHNLFEKADRYRMDNGLLIFTQGNGTPLAKFKLATNEMPQNNKISSLEGTWELDYVADPDGNSVDQLYPEKKPILVFEKGATKVSGNSSCNNFSGSVTIQDHRIKFAPLAMTKMACPGDGERVFTQSLEKTTIFDVQDNALHFIMDDIAIMRFKKK